MIAKRFVAFNLFVAFAFTVMADPVSDPNWPTDDAKPSASGPFWRKGIHVDGQRGAVVTQANRSAMFQEVRVCPAIESSAVVELTRTHRAGQLSQLERAFGSSSWAGFGPNRELSGG